MTLWMVQVCDGETLWAVREFGPYELADARVVESRERGKLSPGQFVRVVEVPKGD